MTRGRYEATAQALGGVATADAPDLMGIEVLSGLRRWVRRGELSASRAEAALDDLDALPLVAHPHEPLRARIWALRDRFTAYDATYVALAEALGATLVTADRALASAAGGITDTLDVA